MAFIRVADRSSCFRPEAVTHFTVFNSLEGSQTHLSSIKIFSAGAQIAYHLWLGAEPLTDEIVGAALKRAEESSETVLSFNHLIEAELKFADDSN
jgi:hypothetical protein